MIKELGQLRRLLVVPIYLLETHLGNVALVVEIAYYRWPRVTLEPLPVLARFHCYFLYARGTNGDLDHIIREQWCLRSLLRLISGQRTLQATVRADELLNLYLLVPANLTADRPLKLRVASILAMEIVRVQPPATVLRLTRPHRYLARPRLLAARPLMIDEELLHSLIEVGAPDDRRVPPLALIVSLINYRHLKVIVVWIHHFLKVSDVHVAIRALTMQQLANRVQHINIFELILAPIRVILLDLTLARSRPMATRRVGGTHAILAIDLAQRVG